MGRRENKWMKRVRNEALIRQRHRCLYCKAPLSESFATSDHRIPRSRGGRFCRANIAAACYPCNVAKADMPPDHFYKLIDRAHPPRGASTTIIMIWATRRINRRADRACIRIKALAR